MLAVLGFGGCVAQSHRLLRRLRSAPLPGPRPESDPSAQALLEWNERALLASRELAVVGPAIRGLGRVALMCGTAVALVLAAERETTLALISFVGGVAASAWVAYIGRLANDRGAELRRAWHQPARGRGGA
jgi:hypothetical protein